MRDEFSNDVLPAGSFDSMTTTLADYFREATGGQSLRAMGARIGIDQSTFRRQLLGDSTPASTIVELCRAYSIPFAPAFIAAQILTVDEALLFSGPPVIEHVSDVELAREHLRRAEAAAS